MLFCGLALGWAMPMKRLLELVIAEIRCPRRAASLVAPRPPGVASGPVGVAPAGLGVAEGEPGGEAKAESARLNQWPPWPGATAVRKPPIAANAAALIRRGRLSRRGWRRRHRHNRLRLRLRERPSLPATSHQAAHPRAD